MKKRITAFVLILMLLFGTVLPTAAPVEASEGTYTYVPQKAGTTIMIFIRITIVSAAIAPILYLSVCRPEAYP